MQLTERTKAIPNLGRSSKPKMDTSRQSQRPRIQPAGPVWGEKAWRLLQRIRSLREIFRFKDLAVQVYSTKGKSMKAFRSCLFMFALVMLTALLSAQTGFRTQTKPLGSVINAHSITCPMGYLAGSSCTELTIHSCPGTADLTATVGYKRGTGIGTVAFLSGSSGTATIDGNIATDLNQFGFDIEQRTYPSAWEDANPKNILKGACREATLINYMYSLGAKPFRAIGKSAGSASIAYSMIWYQGIAPLISHAILIAGPPMTDIEQGCAVPDYPPVTVQPTNGESFQNAPQYVGSFATGVSQQTGYTCQSKSGNTSSTADDGWLVQSVIQPGVVASFPGTTFAGFVCNNLLNNTAAQAQMFYSALVNTSYTLTAVSNCEGAEGVESGTTAEGVSGTVAIERDMEAH